MFLNIAPLNKSWSGPSGRALQCYNACTLIVSSLHLTFYTQIGIVVRVTISKDMHIYYLVVSKIIHTGTCIKT